MSDADTLHVLSDVLEEKLCHVSLGDFLLRLSILSDDPRRPERIALRPYRYQLDLAERWQAGESSVILKARQIGASLLLRAYALWRAAYHGWSIAYYSRGQDEAIAWLDGVAGMARGLPGHLRPWLRRRGTLLQAGAGQIRAFPGSQSAGISYTFQCIIADEAAHHAYGRENYANYAPTISAGGQFICLSTADPALGPSGWFYEMVEAARAGESPYSFLFLPWSAREDRDAEWLAARRLEHAGDEAAFWANYPEAPEDAFRGREGLVYPEFSEHRHLRPAPPVPWGETWERRYSADYGGGDPTAIVVAGTYRRSGESFSRVHIYDLFYRQSGAPTIEEMAAFLGQWSRDSDFTQGEGDPAPGAEPTNASLRALGFPCRRGYARRGEGIGIVRQYLENGWVSFDAERCAPLVHEMRSYRWRPQTDPNSRERYATATPVDHHGDALDALRLLLAGLFRDEMSAGGFGQVYEAVAI